jgi:hypothetical protein
MFLFTKPKSLNFKINLNTYFIHKLYDENGNKIKCPEIFQFKFIL